MKWYQKTWAIVLLLIIFFPAGAFLMWKEKKDWRSPVKILISVVFGFWFLIFATAALYDTSTETSTPNTKTESKSAEEAPKEEAQKEEVKEEETQKEEVKECAKKDVEFAQKRYDEKQNKARTNKLNAAKETLEMLENETSAKFFIENFRAVLSRKQQCERAKVESDHAAEYSYCLKNIEK